MKVIKIKLEEARETISEAAFLEALHVAGLEGEVDVSHATRTVLATDNSIYQRRPTAAIFPRNAADVERIARLLAEERFRSVVVSPRGGGTGTNGQSLTDGIVVDLSRHMNRIIEIDPIKRTARVQAGVVKDQLNAALKPHGLFFAPELSTSNRATIGGMISTDASGQGSCTYGKTRDHVIALKSVLLGGVPLVSEPVDDAALEQLCARTDIVGRAYKTAREISDMAEHSILQTVGIEQRAKLCDVLRELRRRNSRVLDKRLRPPSIAYVAKKADCALSHCINTVDRHMSPGDRVAKTPNAPVRADMLCKFSDTALQLTEIIGAEFNEVDTLSASLVVIVRKELEYRSPDNVIAS